MITGISTKAEVLDHFTSYIEKQYRYHDEDEYLVAQLLIAKAEELISDDVDYWANESVRKLHDLARDILSNGNQ